MDQGSESRTTVTIHIRPFGCLLSLFMFWITILVIHHFVR